jgi:L-lactate utilization protein LutC
MGRAYRVHVRPVAEHIGYIGASEDLVQRFAAEVDAVGGQSFMAADLEAARRALGQLVYEAGATSAVCWQHEMLDRLGLAEFLQARGIQRHNHASLAALPAEAQRRVLLACDIGITSCDCAIAETGTLMVMSGPGQERVASLLPPYHVAIVERRQIVPDLIDAFAMLAARDEDSRDGCPALPSNVTFITGPSKTGDIELQLTTGVHGPGKWRVIILDSA